MRISCLPRCVLCALFLLLLATFHAKSQVLTLEGMVVDSLRHPIEVFDVVAFKADSSALTSGAFTEGAFILTLPEEASWLTLRSIGFYSLNVPLGTLPKEGRYALGTLVMAEDHAELDPVVVKAQRPLVKLKGASYEVDVSRTYLREVGTFMDVARRVPGIVVSSKGDIGVMGKPRVLINLNGRAVQDYSELQSLQANRIKSITVDRNPSTAYAANYDAVIEITTVDAALDYFQLVAQNDFTQSRVAANTTSLTFNGQIRSLSYFASTHFTTDGYLQHDTEEKHVWTDAQELRTIRRAHLAGRKNDFNLNQTLEYRLRPKTILGAGYRFNWSNKKTQRDQKFSMIMGMDTTAIPTSVRNPKTKGISHNPSLYFSSKWSNVSLGIFTDYYTASHDDRQHAIERETKEVHQNFSDRYDVAGVKADFSHSLPFLSYMLGMKGSYIRDEGNYRPSEVEEHVSLQKSYTFASYFNLQKAIGAFQLAAGLRYELECARSTNDGEEMLNTNYHNFFPFFSASYNSSTVVALTYMRRISRPSYGNLITKRVYIDPLSYSVGNVLLRSTLTDIVALSLQTGKFVTAVNYEYLQNSQTPTVELEDKKVKFSYDNIPKGHRLRLYAMYYYGNDILRGSTTALLSFAHMRYQGKVYSTFKDAMLRASTSLEATLWPGATLMLSAQYSTRQYIGVALLKPTGSVSVYFSQYLLNNRLKISLSGEDLFLTERLNNWTQTMRYATVNMDTDADSRLVMLSIRYMFGRSKSKSQSKSSINDETSRL